MNRASNSLIPAFVFACVLTAFGQAASTSPALPVKVLAQSPADTQTELQIICLFQSSGGTLQGSLLETDQKLHGLLTQLWKPGLFHGDLGETVLLWPPAGTVGAKQFLIIGLGDAATFKPERMYLVGKIALREANRLGVAHPYFAPTIRDGGVDKFAAGEIAEQVVHGFEDAMATESLLRGGSAAQPLVVVDFTFLAGSKFATDTQRGIDRVLGKPPSP
jgi:hypothetical protein